MTIYQLNPITDPRWEGFLERQHEASVFQTSAWLQALRLTYGYEPVVFTTSAPIAALENGLVFCHINSWLTGGRIVSLPFSDHCEPLCNSSEALTSILRYLKKALEPERWRYLEVRPLNGERAHALESLGLSPGSRYVSHIMDLSPNVEALFQNLDKDCVQRRIRRAERAGLAEKCGASEELLGHFYKLFVETRRRKHVPPPPFSWFRNLARYQGESLSIRIAYKDHFPVAAILTLRFKNTVYYKYGCSHTDSNHFGATPLLLWRAISAAKSSGAEKFDFGRTEVDNTGLLAFKNHWVPRPKCLVYWRFPDRTNLQSLGDWKMKMAKRLFSYMPGNLLRIAGKLVYKHIG